MFEPQPYGTRNTCLGGIIKYLSDVFNLAHASDAQLPSSPPSPRALLHLSSSGLVQSSLAPRHILFTEYPQLMLKLSPCTSTCGLPAAGHPRPTAWAAAMALADHQARHHPIRSSDLVASY